MSQETVVRAYWGPCFEFLINNIFWVADRHMAGATMVGRRAAKVAEEQDIADEADEDKCRQRRYDREQIVEVKGNRKKLKATQEKHKRN